MKWLEGGGLAFSIIFGIGSLFFSLVFKDLFASCMNTLIYVGLTVYYFKIDEKSRKTNQHQNRVIRQLIKKIIT